MERDPDIAFDWYFSDVSETDGARNAALTDQQAHTQELIGLVNADSIVHFALWSELPEGHPVSELWLESQTDLLATIYLAYGGYFRQAFTVLRSWFEIAMQGIFFAGHFGKPNARYEQWRMGNRNAPISMHSIASALVNRRTSNGVPLTEQAILQKLDPVYSVLSQHAHGRGLDVFDLQDGRDNVPRYLPKSFNLWYETVFSTVDAVYFFYATFYRDDVGSYLATSKSEFKRADSLCDEIGSKLPSYILLIRG